MIYVEEKRESGFGVTTLCTTHPRAQLATWASCA